jgi:type VI protein secretion system component VasF
LIKVANCARATFYRYVTEGSEIELEIQKARAEQRKYIESITEGDGDVEREASSRERRERAEAGARELLAFITRMTENLQRLGVEAKIIQAAQREAMPHPQRSFSHVGKGSRRK